MPLDYPDHSTGQPDRQPQHPSPPGKALLWRCQNPDDAAAVRRLGDLLYELVNESRKCGPGDEENCIRSVLMAPARDLLLNLRMGNGTRGRSEPRSCPI